MIRFVKLVKTFFSGTLLFLFMSTVALASNPRDGALALKVDELKKKLDQIEKTQEEILTAQDEIKELLKQVKIWVRRH